MNSCQNEGSSGITLTFSSKVFVKKYLLFLVCVLLASCSKSTYLSYEPALETQPPKNISVSLSKFEDVRKCHEIGYFRLCFIDLCSNTNVLGWAMQALKDECSNAGYCVTDDIETSAVTIEGKIIEVFCDTYLTYSGKVRVELKAKHDGRLLFAKEYEVEENGGLNWIPSSSASASVLKKGLQNVYAQFISDLLDEFPAYYQK